MRKKSTKTLMLFTVFILSIFLAGANGFAAPPGAANHETDSKTELQSGSITKMPMYYLVVEDMYRNHHCEIILKVANKGVAPIPPNIYGNIRLRIKRVIDGVTITLPTGWMDVDISSPGATCTLNTHIKVETSETVEAYFVLLNDVTSVKTAGLTESMGPGVCGMVFKKAPKLKAKKSLLPFKSRRKVKKIEQKKVAAPSVGIATPATRKLMKK
jgi:hypothetical protein